MFARTFQYYYDADAIREPICMTGDGIRRFILWEETAARYERYRLANFATPILLFIQSG
jgi:hypothetical protein